MAYLIMGRAAALLQSSAGAFGSRRLGAAVLCTSITRSTSCFFATGDMVRGKQRKKHTDARVVKTEVKDEEGPVPATRSYAEALEKLSQLSSNRSATDLFEGAGSKDQTKTAEDVNAAAIPEMRAWLLRAGYTPERDLAGMRHIHVAGTKGKGSVCAYATALLISELRGRGRRVGTYTSPHLVSPRERIAIDGRPVSQEVFAAAFFELWDRFTEAARRQGGRWSDEEARGVASKPFFFRYLTIMAWHIFLREGVRDVVLECGIGGEHDATNVLPPEAVSAAVVTQLGVDHVAMLGTTVEAIAWHKAGIFRPGRRAFTRRLAGEPGVMEVLRTRASDKGAVLVEVDDHEVDKWGVAAGHESPTTTPSTASFQKQNQALAALAVMEHLNPDWNGSNAEAAPASGLLNLPDDIYDRLQGLELPGRQEIYKDTSGTSWYLDGAHTTESLEQTARWFVASMKETDQPAVLVFNQQESHRDVSALLESLLGAVEKIHGSGSLGEIFGHAVFSANNTSFLDDKGEEWDLSVQERAAATMRRLVPGCKVEVVGNVMDACLDASRAATADGREGSKVLVTGSMHLVGNVKRVLDPETLM